MPPDHDFNPLIVGEVVVKSGGGRDNGDARHHRVLSFADSTTKMMMDTTIPIGDTLIFTIFKITMMQQPPTLTPQ